MALISTQDWFSFVVAYVNLFFITVEKVNLKMILKIISALFNKPLSTIWNQIKDKREKRTNLCAEVEQVE